MEDALESAALDDLSTNALERYRFAAKVTDAIGSPAFNRDLIRHGLLARKEDGRFVPTGLGFVLFGKSPRSAVPQSGLLGTIRYPDGTQELHDFDGPLVLIPEQVEDWLQAKLPNVIDRSHMQRRSQGALPFEMIREAVVNALVHRDYDIAGAKSQLEVTENAIVVQSPGKPVSPITVEQLQAFSAPMLSRNPEMHYVLARMGLAEERGLGLKTLKLGAEGLPLPSYSFEAPYLTLTLYRNREGAARMLEPSVLGSLNDEERAGWAFISSVIEMTASEYAKRFGFEERKVQRHLKKFVSLGLLRKVGAGRATKYEIVRT